MTHRSAAAALALAFSLAIPAVALADVPPADGGSGGSASTSSGSGVLDADCTVAAQTMAGHTCQQCQIEGSSDSACEDELGSNYNFVCKYSATAEVWCDGPNQLSSTDPSCALHAVSTPLHGGAVAALLGMAVAALAVRRRRG
jgi:hypothetical protein